MLRGLHTAADSQRPTVHGIQEPTRLIICIDGTYCTADGPEGKGHGNTSNVYRLFASIKAGKCPDGFNQEKHYEEGIGSADEVGSLKRLTAGVCGAGYQDFIQKSYEQCCQLTSQDEIWLFGFSRGAYIARAVAGLLDYIGALNSTGDQFKKDYKKMLEVYNNKEKRSRIGRGQIHSFLALHTKPKARIQFVGVFDTVKALDDASLHDISFNDSIQHLRHALALNEDRAAMTPEYVFPHLDDQIIRSWNRSIIQAWFIGAHIDMGGSAKRDGLSLYPLQWMLLESQAKGLVLEFSVMFDHRVQIDNPLRVVFPESKSDGKGSETWTCTTENGVDVWMQDLRQVHELPKYKSRYAIQLNNHKSVFWPRKAREPFNTDGYLRGFCSFGEIGLRGNPEFIRLRFTAHQGTIIHPSVYQLLDEFLYTALNKKAQQFHEQIGNWRPKMLGMLGDELNLLNQGFWANRECVHVDDLQVIRILVCGNTGVGKSTLINRIFGIEIAKSSDRNRGLHRIEDELKHPQRSNLRIHDSGGFEASDIRQMQAVENFVRDKASQVRLEDRLHVIWFCVEMNSVRTKQTATEELFRAVSKYATDIPILVVATKQDDFEGSKSWEGRRLFGEHFQGDAAGLLKKCDEYAADEVRNRMQLIETEMQEVEGGRFDACVGVAKDEPHSIELLNQTTLDSFNNGKVRLMYVAAQVANIDMKINCAIIEIMKVYRSVLGTTSGLGLIPGAPSTNRTAAATSICLEIVKCFRLPTISSKTIWRIIKLNIWDDLGHNVSIAVSEAIATIGLLSSIGMGGIPISLVSGAINLPLVVPATTRLMLLLAADLILVLTRAFKVTTYTCIGHPEVKDLENAAKWYRPMSINVHKEVMKLVPKRNLVKSFRCNEVQLGLERIVRDYKEKVIENTTPDMSMLNIKTRNGEEKAAIAEIQKDIEEEVSVLPSFHEVADIVRLNGFEDAVHKVQVEVQAEVQT